MNKRYKIKIEEEVIEETLTGREWAKSGKKNEAGNDTYEYTPQVPTKKKVTRTVFEQNTDDLDLIEVIKAVNGIGAEK